MNNLKILVIQNTDYHFETAISLYKSLKYLKPKRVSILPLDTKNCENQIKFYIKHNINYISDSDERIYSYDIAFIVTAVPDPSLPIEKRIPNDKHPIIQYYKTFSGLILDSS